MNESAQRVALTFDAEHPDRSLCPPENAERILDILRDAGVRCSFFLQGRWARSQPDTAHRIARDGHLIGHHSHYHARLPLLTDQGIREDVTDGETAIREVTGVDPRPWFRCPFGAGHEDPRVREALDDLGYRNVHWNVELEDWEPWRSAEDIAHDAVDGALAWPEGAVVLLHTWPAPTAAALPAILEGLSSAGTRFVAVDELERLP